jgi:hypothetical protein
MPAKLLIVCYILIGKSKITNIANERRNRKKEIRMWYKRRKKCRIEG